MPTQPYFAVAPSDAPACEAFDAFFGDMLQSETLYKLGFSFGGELYKLNSVGPIA